MRDLTKKQKVMLLNWANKELREPYMFDRADKIDAEIYNLIDAENPCEIFYNNANDFLEKLEPIYLHGISDLGIIGWKKPSK
jgi:hypothetical protein